jgi:hypothetical protein
MVADWSLWATKGFSGRGGVMGVISGGIGAV